MTWLIDFITERPVLFARYVCYIAVAVATVVGVIFKKRKSKEKEVNNTAEVKAVEKPKEKSSRDEAIRYIKSIILPELRKIGFKGSYPHFRRENAEGYDLLSFQFNKYGGSFLMEMSVAYPQRAEYKNCYLLGIKPYEEEIKKIDTSNTYARHRVINQEDEWFHFTDDIVEDVIKTAWSKLKEDLIWYDDPPIYEELEKRKAKGLRY